MPEAEELRAGLVEPQRSAFDRVYLDLVVAGGCDAHVDADFVRFAYNGATVAAMYPRDSFFEVALALPSDTEGDEIKDATHLGSLATPICVEVRTEDDLERCLGHLREAVERARSAPPGARPPHDHFTRRATRGAGPPGTADPSA